MIAVSYEVWPNISLTTSTKSYRLFTIDGKTSFFLCPNKIQNDANRFARKIKFTKFCWPCLRRVRKYLGNEWVSWETAQERYISDEKKTSAQHWVLPLYIQSHFLFFLRSPADRVAKGGTFANWHIACILSYCFSRNSFAFKRFEFYTKINCFSRYLSYWKRLNWRYSLVYRWHSIISVTLRKQSSSQFLRKTDNSQLGDANLVKVPICQDDWLIVWRNYYSFYYLSMYILLQMSTA